MKKKTLTLSLFALALASCASSGQSSSSSLSDSQSATQASSEKEPSSSEESFSSDSALPPDSGFSSEAGIKLTKALDSKIYLTPDSEGNVSASTSLPFPVSFFSVNEDVPYVNLKNFFANFFNAILTSGFQVYSCEDGVATNLLTGASMEFDAETNTITTSNLDAFQSMVEDGHLDHDNLQAESDGNAKIQYEKCSSAAGKTMRWNLEDYYMQLVSYGGEVYVPYSIIQTLFLSPLNLSLAFNGSDFYNASQLSSFYSNPAEKTRTLNGYGKAYYGGPLGDLKQRTKGYSEYFYGSFLFTMETSNGKINLIPYASLDSELDSKGYKDKLLSSDSFTSDKAIADVVCKLFCDGGHTGFTSTGVTAGADIERDIPLMREIYSVDSRYIARHDVETRLQALRGDAKTNGLIIEGKTAIIRFDSFSIASDPSTGRPLKHTKENVSTDTTSTFALFYNSFEEIRENGGIENVVFDVSLNGGGAAMALGETLGFLTNGDVSFVTTNYVTGSKNTEVVAYDTDLDEDFTDDDSEEGNYNFYVLTSPVSFSCGNAFPCLASESGYAKVIGQKSGGGDCVVGFGVAVDGTYWQMSSTSSITRKNGFSVDDGCVLDYEIDYGHFYDVKYLDGFLSGLGA